MKRFLAINGSAFAFSLLIGAGNLAAQEVRNTPAVLSAPGGRYVYGQISEFGRDRFMLDTQTGRLWQLVTDKDDNYWLAEIPYRPGSALALPPSSQSAPVNTDPFGILPHKNK